MHALIEGGADFDAVFGLNDALALGALSALQAHGIRVPDEVAVIGFDDVEEARFASPPLTTIESGLDWVAARAVDLLLERIAGAAGGPRAEIAGHALVQRETTPREPAPSPRA